MFVLSLYASYFRSSQMTLSSIMSTCLEQLKVKTKIWPQCYPCNVFWKLASQGLLSATIHKLKLSQMITWCLPPTIKRHYCAMIRASPLDFWVDGVSHCLHQHHLLFHLYFPCPKALGQQLNMSAKKSFARNSGHANILADPYLCRMDRLSMTLCIDWIKNLMNQSSSERSAHVI